ARLALTHTITTVEQLEAPPGGLDLKDKDGAIWRTNDWHGERWYQRTLPPDSGSFNSPRHIKLPAIVLDPAPVISKERVEAAARAVSPSQWEVYDNAVATPDPSREYPAEYIVRPSLELVSSVLTAAGIPFEEVF